MKKFIVNFGSGLIDFSAWVVFVALIVAAFVCMFVQDFLYGFLVLLVGLILFVALYYTIYLAISINDNLEEIKNCLKRNKDEE